MAFRNFFSRNKDAKLRNQQESSQGQKSITNSQHHDMAQVLSFANGAHDGTAANDIGRDLFSFPKPEKKETMKDYLNNHNSGDIFPYIAITGKEEETKDNRIARLRAFASPYNKESKPEMRVNGLVLDLLVGSLHIDDLKSHVDNSLLSKAQTKQNKQFKEINTHVFKKPYVHIKKITGEFVPLLSGSADYTELYFSLQDGRLLEHQVVVQSNKIPTNNVGVIEMSCDYCIPTADIKQISIRYELARPIMKEGFQWGTVSLVISVDESDTPYLTPKVEAMAIVRAPYTSMETQQVDQDHKDVTYTAAQIKSFRELYINNDIADNDEPLKERKVQSSYPKSSIRGQQKTVKAPEHLGSLPGWSQMQDSRKPLITADLASVSAASGGDEDDSPIRNTTISEWEEEQKRMRTAFDQAGLHQARIPKPPMKPAIKKPRVRSNTVLSESTAVDSVSDDSSDESEPEIFKTMADKGNPKPVKHGVAFNIDEI